MGMQTMYPKRVMRLLVVNAAMLMTFVLGPLNGIRISHHV